MVPSSARVPSYRATETFSFYLALLIQMCAWNVLFVCFLVCGSDWLCFFLSLASAYLRTVGAPEHTQWHTQSVGLLWTRDRPVADKCS